MSIFFVCWKWYLFESHCTENVSSSCNSWKSMNESQANQWSLEKIQKLSDRGLHLKTSPLNRILLETWENIFSFRYWNAPCMFNFADNSSAKYTARAKTIKEMWVKHWMFVMDTLIMNAWLSQSLFEFSDMADADDVKSCNIGLLWVWRDLILSACKTFNILQLNIRF